MLKTLLLTTITFFFVGCGATKMQIQSVKPAETSAIKSGSSIAVLEFKNERDNMLSSKIESKLVSKNIENSNYFNVVSRQDINSVMKEQRLQGSDMFDSSKAVRFGKLVGADVLVSGTASKKGLNNYYIHYYKTCARYNKETKECIRYERHSQKCLTVDATIQATINLLDVEKGSISYSKQYSKNIQSDTCRFGKKIRNKDEAFAIMIDEISKDFTTRVTPSKIYSYIELIEDLDYELTEKQEQLFENGIKYIKQNRINRAKEIFENLNYETAQKSYEIVYNNGVIAESEGNFQKALQFYLLSDKLVPEPSDLISRAILRTQKNMKSEQIVRNQIK